MYSQPPNWRLVTNHHPVPTIDAGLDLVLPLGQTLVQAMATTDSPTNTIAWSGPGGYSSPVLQPFLSAVGTYTIQATNTYGCSASDQLLLRLANPLDTFWMKNPLPTLCFGSKDSIILDNYVSHSYMVGSSFSGPGVVGRILYPTVVGKNNIINWTLGAKTLPVFQTTHPKPNDHVYQDTLLSCQGQTGWLGAVGSADSYSWSLLPDSTVLSTNQYYSVTVTSPKQYLLTAGLIYTDKTCYTSDTTTVLPVSGNFTINRLVRDTTFGTFLGSNVTCIPDFKLGTSYVWNFGDSYVASAQNTSTAIIGKHNYSQKGWNTINLRTATPCGSFSSSQTIYVNLILTTDVNTPDGSNKEIQLYPNPAIDYIYLDFGEAKVSQLQIFDISGRVISTQTINSMSYRIDVSSFRTGMYIVKLYMQSGSFLSARFEKQ